MRDFTSMLYLGMRHQAGALRPWARLTTGLPSAFEEPPEAPRLARRLAALIGCESALIAPSTLHLFWDLPSLVGPGASVLIESGTYAIGRWGAERCASLGMPVRTFAHHDPDGLRRALTGCPPGRRPVVVVDGLSPPEGDPAPIHAYAEQVARHGGRLVIDDTQTLGILGSTPDELMPYGHGGGGSLRFHGVNTRHVLVIASLSKGFGAPLAFLAGARPDVERFASSSETRVHCSPPSIVAMHAAERALAINEGWGERLRTRLLRLVRLFRSGVERLGLRCSGGTFPVQALLPMAPALADAVLTGLRRRGVRAFAVRHGGSHARLCFVLTARHSRADVEHALAAIESVRPLLNQAALAV